MKSRDVLVIGAGISGCATALALARRGIPVTIVTSALDQRSYHSSFMTMENLDKKIQHVKEYDQQSGCSRANEQLINAAKKSAEELLEPRFLVDSYKNTHLHSYLQEQLRQMSHVEWMTQHSVIELLTLEEHSLRKSDVYKRSACLGACLYNHETHQVEQLMAKETILATGGVTPLFPYSTTRGNENGIAMAHRAGARLLHVDHIHFHPLALFNREKPCLPLPLDLLREGGKLQASSIVGIDDLCEELFKSQADHLWLDLTKIDSTYFKERFPEIDAYCLSYGCDASNDLVPVVPAAQYTCGGIAVDRVAQTTVHRLRAVGEVSCTGLTYDFADEAMNVLESLTWAVACADDIAKQISKFIYYFPEIREWNRPIQVDSSSLVKEDWQLVHHIMWHYVGMLRNEQRLKRGLALLQQLKSYNEAEWDDTFSLEKTRLIHALQTATLITQEALRRCDLKSSREINLVGVA